MTSEQIREIVKITIEELTDKKLLKSDNYSNILKKVELALDHFFNNVGDAKKVGYALNQLSDDPYIDIIFLQYRDDKTLEWIAEYYDKDISTIKRNKKRLILSIYELL